MTSTSLDKAALAAGIALTYFNANGEPEAISDETKRALLAVMENPQKASKSPLPPVVVFSGNRQRMLAPQIDGRISWQLQTEKGKTLAEHSKVVRPLRCLLLWGRVITSLP